MDIKKFDILLTVVDTGSFSKAAEKLGYTQAGVSYIINSLEEEIGLRLLIRNYNGVKLNDNGNALIDEIRKLVDGEKRLSGMIQARKRKFADKLHIGSIDTVAIKWLPKAAVAFEEAYPDVHIDMVTGDPFEINDWIEEGTVDLGLTELLWAAKDYRWIELVRDPFYGIFPQGEDIGAVCPIERFTGRKFFIPDFRQDRNVPILLRENGVKAEFLYDKASTPSILRSIAMGRGTSILSALAIDLGARGAGESEQNDMPEIVPLIPDAYRELGVSLKEEKLQEPLIRAFVSCLREVIRADSREGYFVIKQIE